MFSVTKTKERRGKKKKDVCPLLLENPRPLSPLQEPQTLSPPRKARTSYQSASCSVEPDCLQPHQALLSMGFSRQGYWSGLPFPYLGDFPDPGIEPRSPALQTDSLPTELQGKP